jgi:hypothetical protein
LDERGQREHFGIIMRFIAHGLEEYPRV